MSSNQFTSGSQSASCSQEKKIRKKTYNKRITRKKANEIKRKFWLCKSCLNQKMYQKKYMSYPALYTHVKQKHKSQKIHFQKMDLQINSQTQMQKSRKMLNTVDTMEREQLEQCLIESILMIKLKLIRQFVKGKKIDKTLIGDKDMDEAVIEVLLEAKIMGNQMGLNAGILSSMENLIIFKEYYGRFGKISFGKDIVRFFSRNRETAVRLQLQMILFDAIDRLLIDKKQFLIYSLQLWGCAGKQISLLLNGWRKWKLIQKSILLQDYPQIDIEVQQSI